MMFFRMTMGLQHKMSLPSPAGMVSGPSTQSFLEAHRSFNPSVPATSTKLPPLSSSSLPHRNARSILEWIDTTCPIAQKQQLIYVVVDLKRPSVHESWGISFSQFDHHIILGRVEPSLMHRMTWSSVIFGNENTLDHNTVFPSIQDHQSRVNYRTFMKYYARSKQTTGCTLHNQVLPGDMIIAIDGIQPIQLSNLHEITNYLRSSVHLSLVLVRHPQAMAASLLHPQTCAAGPSVYQVWKRVLLDFMAPLVRQGPMARQVTPNCRSPTTFGIGPSAVPRINASVQLHLQRQIWDRIRNTHPGTALPPNSNAPKTESHFLSCRNTPKKLPKEPTKPIPVPDDWRNPWFQENNQSIPFDDNWEFSPEDGSRAALFLPPINNFQTWLQHRKTTWKQKYNVYKHENENEENDGEPDESDLRTVSVDFWTHQGFASFEAWLHHRKERWRTNYKVYRNKRRRIHKECEEVVHLNEPTVDEFNHWLRIRKKQWKVLRRKQQRQREENISNLTEQVKAPKIEAEEVCVTSQPLTAVVTPEKQDEGCDPILRKEPRTLFPKSSADIEMACIDDILEEEERQRKALAERPPIDISFLFDANKMAPDDVVVHIFEYLERKEHSRLLRVNKDTSDLLKSRDEVWRQLCPSHWVLPRRPRKPWHEIYFSKLRREQFNCQKTWDDLLLKCYAVLLKGDYLHKIEKLVSKGEADFGFDTNYVSPVVCERNCLLNLAVIHERHKVVRWLVDRKGAAIESYDRGHFTPLLNAAWAGDKQIVRFLLQRGANRSKVGFYHYTKPVSSPDFAGLTAEGWARRKGHDSIAELIRLGL